MLIHNRLNHRQIKQHRLIQLYRRHRNFYVRLNDTIVKRKNKVGHVFDDFVKRRLDGGRVRFPEGFSILFEVVFSGHFGQFQKTQSLQIRVPRHSIQVIRRYGQVHTGRYTRCWQVQNPDTYRRANIPRHPHRR
jgi:hypothetical protein